MLRISVVFLLILVAGPAYGQKTRIKGDPTKQPSTPQAGDPTGRLLYYLKDKNPFVRAAAIDILGNRKEKAAIPKLVELIGDRTGLIGSDNYIARHAAIALSRITGRPFSVDLNEWKEWLQAQRKK